jgi:hypothetical protein
MRQKNVAYIVGALAVVSGAALWYGLPDNLPITNRSVGIHPPSAETIAEHPVPPVSPSASGSAVKITEKKIPVKEWFARALKNSEQAETLSPSEAQDMLWFIENVTSVEGIPELTLAETKNNLLNRLGEEASPELYSATLLRIQGDKKQSEVMRDYAVQYLSQFYDRIPDQKAVQNAFWERTDDTQGTTAPTALIALHGLANKAKLEDPERLNVRVREIASLQSAPDSARMTALNILSSNQAKQALITAKGILQEERSVALTTVAIGTVASFGSAKDAELLKSLPLSARPEYRRSIENALKTLNQ